MRFSFPRSNRRCEAENVGFLGWVPVYGIWSSCFVEAVEYGTELGSFHVAEETLDVFVYMRPRYHSLIGYPFAV